MVIGNEKWLLANEIPIDAHITNTLANECQAGTISILIAINSKSSGSYPGFFHGEYKIPILHFGQKHKGKL